MRALLAAEQGDRINARGPGVRLAKTNPWNEREFHGLIRGSAKLAYGHKWRYIEQKSFIA